MINVEEMHDQRSDLILEKGCPADLNNRIDKEQRVYRLLDRLGLEYWHLDHPAAATMEDCQEIDRIMEAKICKNLFLCNRQETQFYLLLMPGDKVFKTKELSGQLGCARLSFASAEYMERYLDITPGSVSIMGLMNDTDNHVQLLIDQDLLSDPFLLCHPCINTGSLKLHREDVLTHFLKEIHHDPIYVCLGDGG